LADFEAGARFPLLASGFSSNVGTYSDNKREPGGVWEGDYAIIIWGDFRGEQVELDEQFKYIQDKGGNKIDVFNQDGVEMVNPTQG